MTTPPPLPTLESLKLQAKRLRSELSISGNTIAHSHALELIAHQCGHRDWNTLRAAVGNHPPSPPVTMGGRTQGHYLGQPFKGNVIGIQQVSEGRFRITLEFDDPVDVVSFDSFSAYRNRVTCTVNSSGQSAEKTSNGKVQMSLQAG